MVSPTAPVLTYSTHAFATASLGSQTASLGLPLYSAAGTAAAFWGFFSTSDASQPLLMSTGFSVWSLLPLSGRRIAMQASRYGIAK